MVWNIFFMFGGVAAMMAGMKIMGAGLEKFAGGNMKRLLGKVTSNRLAGVGVGIAVTSIIQSSTATTVMLVGFVNIGLMTLTQAAHVIMGANIGTTITAHIVSLSGLEGGINVGAIAAMIGCIGMLMTMLVKNDKVQNIGNILAGLGLIFVGLEFISTFAKLIMFEDGESIPYPFVKAVFQGDHFPLLLVVIGIVLTALVHSSSTITSLMVVLASIKVLSFNNALFLALGSNIGTCITSLLSSVGTCTNAKRTAIFHLLFNVFGCLLFIAPLWVFQKPVADMFLRISPDVGQQIAVFHTLFNLVTTIILLPFSKYVVKLACLIVRDVPSKGDEKQRFQYIDDRLMETPAVAVSNIKHELIRMGGMAKENVNIAIDMLLDKEVDHTELFTENEDALNYLNKSITIYLTKLMGKNLTDGEDKKVGAYYHVVSDIERVGDYAENIVEFAMKLREDNMDFSDEAKNELMELTDTVNTLYTKAIEAFDSRRAALLPDVEEIEESIDQLCVKLEEKHIDRVKKGSCTAELGSAYLQTVSHMERIGDHITNVASSIRYYRHH